MITFSILYIFLINSSTAKYINPIPNFNHHYLWTSNYAKPYNGNYLSSNNKSRISKAITCGQENNQTPCSEASEMTSDAFLLSEKAKKSKNVIEMKTYMRKVISIFEKAIFITKNCDCVEAEVALNSGLIYSKKALTLDDIKVIKELAKKANDSATIAISAYMVCNGDTEY